MGFNLDRADFGMRLIAEILDVMIILVPIAIIMYLSMGTLSLNATQGVMGNSLYIVYSMIVPVIWRGYNVGKRLVNIKIKKSNGKGLTLLDMFLREFIGKFFLAYVTVSLSTIISALMIMFRIDKRAIHDFLAGTYVSNES